MHNIIEIHSSDQQNQSWGLGQGWKEVLVVDYNEKKSNSSNFPNKGKKIISLSYNCLLLLTQRYAENNLS